MYGWAHHGVPRPQKFPGDWRKAPRRRHAPRTLGLCHMRFGFGGRFRRLILWPRIPVSRKRRLRQSKSGSTIYRVSAEVRPSIWRCRDHSAGMSQRRATPIPRGSRPSMAALTRSGARKAREIVMLTLRTLQPSRLAFACTFAMGSALSSSSQRRPRAIDATSVARVSERIGRASLGGIGPDSSISRRRVNSVLCQGMWSAFLPSPFDRLLLKFEKAGSPSGPVEPRPAQHGW